jgi:hypothetical protein
MLSKSDEQPKAPLIIDVGHAALYADGSLRVGEGGIRLTARQAGSLGKELVAWAERQTRAKRVSAGNMAVALRRRASCD